MSVNYIFPFDTVQENSRVIIYGMGMVGIDYLRQVRKSQYCEVLFAVDRNYDAISRAYQDEISILSPEAISSASYDNIVIANANRKIAMEIREYLQDLGVLDEKIIYGEDFSDASINRYAELISPYFGTIPLFKVINEKKIIIYGDGRAALDLLYVFPNLSIEYFIANDNEEKAKHLPKPVNDFSVLENENVNDIFIIVCSYEPQKAKTRLDSLSLIYGKQWLYAENFALLLDFPYENIHRRGKLALLMTEKEELVEYFAFGCYYGFTGIDTIISSNIIEYPNFTGTVVHPDEITYKDYFIIVTGSERDNIKQKFLDEGLSINKDFIIWNYWSFLPSMLYYKAMYTKPTKMPIEGACFFVFDYFQIDADGLTSYICCPVFFQPGLGSVNDEPILDIYHSNIATVQRLSLANHTFSFCVPYVCGPQIAYKEELDVRESIDHISNEQDYEKRAGKYPKRLALGIDSTCNLNCVFCRKELIKVDPNTEKRLEKLTDKLLSEVIPHIKYLLIAGNGEVFFSKIYRKLIFNKNLLGDNPQIGLELLSNGILFTKENFERLEPLYKSISLNVSIDAGSKETYEKLRRNGKWEKLVENMRYAGELRKAGRLKYLEVSYIGTTQNCFEIPSFIKWMKSINVDRIVFRNLHRMEAMTNEQFMNLSLFDATGKCKEEYISVLNDPLLCDPIVCNGNLLGNLLGKI